MDARVISFEIPYPPSVNDWWRSITTNQIGKNGNRRIIKGKTDKAKNYINNVALMIQSQRHKIGEYPEYRLEVKVYPPDNRKRDIDNILKAVLDVLQVSKVFRNDYQVSQLYAERCQTIKPFGKLVITLYGLGGE